MISSLAPGLQQNYRRRRNYRPLCTRTPTTSLQAVFGRPRPERVQGDGKLLRRPERRPIIPGRATNEDQRAT